MTALSSMVALCRVADAHEMARDIAALNAARQARIVARLVKRDAPRLARLTNRGLVVDHASWFGEVRGHLPRSRRAQRLAGYVR